MPQASPEEVGRELSDLAFGIVEQNWLEQHIGKVANLKSVDQLQLNIAEWELTYLILFAITNGCGTFSAAGSDRITSILKAFHSTLLSHIADQAGQEVADEHKKNLPARYRLYGQAIEGEDTNKPYKTAYRLLGEAAALQILGKPFTDPHDADNFRETIKVVFTEVREAAIKVMSFQQAQAIEGKA
jgi:hypothetical protein